MKRKNGMTMSASVMPVHQPVSASGLWIKQTFNETASACPISKAFISKAFISKAAAEDV